MGRSYKGLKVFFRILIILFLFLVIILPGLIFITLKIPAVQQYVLNKVTGTIEDKTLTKFKIDRVSIGFLHNIKIKGIYLEDKNKDTLAYIGDLEVSFHFMPLIHKNISISDVDIRNAYLNVYRNSGSQDFNYSFLINAFSDTSSTSSSNWNVDLGEFDLQNIRLDYKDVPGGNDLKTRLTLFKVDFEDLGLDNNHLIVNNALINGLHLKYNLTKSELTKTSDSVSSSPMVFTVKDLSIKQSDVTYNDLTQNPLNKGVDFNHLDLKDINSDIKNIEIAGTEIEVLINGLSFKEKSGFELQDLVVAAHVDSSSVKVDLKKVTTPKSHLDHAVFFNVPMGNNADISKATFRGDFKNEAIAIHDVKYFLPGIDTIAALKNKVVKLSGDLKGNLNDFYLKNSFISLDNSNFLKADLVMKGLPNMAETMIDLEVDMASVQSSLLTSFFLEDTTINLKALGSININGSIEGKLIAPVTDIAIRTNAGTVAIDAQVRMDTSFNFLGLKGDIKTSGFKLNKVIASIPVNDISMAASADVEGMDIKYLNADLSSVAYNNYNYHNISINGNYVNDAFSGEIISKDSNLLAHINIIGSITKSDFEIRGSLKEADLYALHFSDSILTVKGDVEASFNGTNIDSITGQARIKDIIISTASQKLELDSISAFADLNNSIRSISISSPIVNLDVSGQFVFEELPNVFNHLLQNYYPTVVTNISGITLNKTQNINFKLSTGDLSAIAGFFDPSVKELDNLNVSGSFNKETNEIRLSSSLDKINFSGTVLDGFKLSAKGEGKDLSFKVSAEDIKAGENITLDTTMISGVLEDGQLSFNVRLHNPEVPTRINLNGKIEQLRDTLYLTIPAADIFVKGKKWEISKGNRIAYSNDFLDIKNFVLTEGSQKISISSVGKEKNALQALFNNVHLEELMDLAGLSSYNVAGVINGDAKADNIFSDPGINTNLRVDSLILNKQEMGNLRIDALKKSGEEKLSLNILLNGRNEASLKGYYLTNNGNADIYLHIGELHLQPLEPFVKQFAFQLQGMVSGNFHLQGSISNPNLEGMINFDGLNRIGLNVTNTIYRINNQSIFFQPSAIHFDHFSVIDSMQNKATANGYIYHDNFDHFKFDLSFDTDKFELVNSDYSDEAALYGKLWANMHITVSGPLEDLAVKLNAETLKGTKLFVPLASSAQSSSITPDYIHFHKIEMDTTVAINKNNNSDSLRKSFVSTKVDLSKFDISGQLKFTKEAELNIVVDPVNGDKITARGRGNFSFDFNSANEMNIYGTYVIDNGSYAFTFVNLIKKNFKIEKGSSISWSGDPMNASLNITAIYETRASRYELIQDQLTDMSKEQIDAAKHPMPVDVYLSLKGSLESPDISFKIDVPEGEDPLNGSIVAQEISNINSDPNELNKEVFSLIITNKFIGGGNNSITNSGSSVALGEVNKSVSRILNSQLNKLSDDFLKGVDINVNLQSLDQSYGSFAQNAEITASKKISPRITVSAGGNVNINSNYGSGQFAGDYYIYYRVNPSGSVNLKFFRTSQQNLYTNNLYTNQGFSVTYRKDFNGWKNIFNEARRKEEEE